MAFPQAQAIATGGNGGDRGGGLGLHCPDGKIYLADTYGLLEAVNVFSSSSEQKIMGILLNRLDVLSKARSSYFSQRFFSNPRFAKYNSIEKMLKAVIKDELTITHVETLPLLKVNQYVARNGCEPVQIAEQDLSTGHIKWVETLVNRLSNFDRAMLKIHEALVFLTVEREDTSDIRNFLAYLTADTAMDSIRSKLEKSNTQVHIEYRRAFLNCAQFVAISMLNTMRPGSVAFDESRGSSAFASMKFSKLLQASKAESPESFLFAEVILRMLSEVYGIYPVSVEVDFVPSPAESVTDYPKRLALSSAIDWKKR